MIRTLAEVDLESVYADDYEPKFPTPLELAAVFCLMPLVALAKAWRWVCDNSGFCIVILAVLGYFFGAAATFLPYFLKGGTR